MDALYSRSYKSEKQMRWHYLITATLISSGGIWMIVQGLDRSSIRVTQATETIAASRPSAHLADHFTLASAPAGPVHRTLPPIPSRVADYIAREYAQSAVTRAVITQITLGWNQAIHNAGDARTAHAAGNTIAQGIACAMSTAVLVRAGITPQEMIDRIMSTRSVMLDSEADSREYLHFQSLASGQVFDDSSPNTCRFNPTTMPN
ncbi:hypothetical protein [Burkholderia cenocepacia]|uniref:hypothetical protein n=2 Tax=Burkholderia cenocepacia TaxID=95486 RepID=UPI002AB7CD79|nr:hypothetical protein [Burkholderia cenocepacia]